jgi:DNA primase
MMVRQFIPEETIQEVLLRADIVDVISDYVQLKKGGANYKGLCPFHSEKTPSFTVSPAKHLYYCFGCQASGNVIGFLMRYENLSFPEAVRHLAARYSVPVSDDPAPQQQVAVEPLYRLHQAAATFFHHCLLHDPASQQARAYCRRRQITSDTVARFCLGYAPASWDALSREMQRQAFSQDVLLRSGLVTARESRSGTYDRFRNRLIFPIYDRLGRPVAFGGRLLEGTETIPAPKYLNSPDTAIFHKGQILYGFHLAKQTIRQEGRVLLVEGYTDVIACHRQGVMQTVGTLGTALTERHVEMLKGLAKEVILVFDSDTAGGSATERGIELLLGAGIRVRVVTLPEGEDPDSFLQQHEGPELLRRVDTAMTFVEYQLARAQRLYDLQTPAGRADCVSRILPLLAKVENQVERWGYVTLLAEKIGVPIEVIQRQMSSRVSNDVIDKPSVDVPLLRSTSTLPRVEYELLRLMLHDVSTIAQVQQHITPDDFHEPLLRSIYLLLLHQAAQDRQPLFPMILEHAETPAQRQLLAKMAAEPIVIDVHEGSKALQDYLLHLRRRDVQTQLRHLRERIREAERRGDAAVQQRLLQEYTVLSRARQPRHQRGLA